MNRKTRNIGIGVSLMAALALIGLAALLLHGEPPPTVQAGEAPREATMTQGAEPDASIIEVEWSRVHSGTLDGVFYDDLYWGGLSNSAPTLIDIDGDGDLDLFVQGSNRLGRDQLHFFRNDGTTAAPVWTHVTSNYFGWYSRPVQFADLDGDGDLDAILAGWPWEPEGFIYYENTGTATAPTWALRTTDMLGDGRSSNLGFALLDIDGDGDLDLFFVHEWEHDGEQLTGITFYENTGSPTEPAWTFVTDTYTDIICEGPSAQCFVSIAFPDIDDDDDLDLFLGESNQIRHYRNDGTTGDPVWNFVTDTYGGIRLPYGWAVMHFALTFGDLDGNGTLDLVVGQTLGWLTSFKNVGTPANANWELWMDGMLPIDFGNGANPALADIDNDGDLDLLLGVGSGLDGAQLIFMRNDGTPAEPLWTYVPGNFGGISPGGFQHPTFVDIDGDGDQDLFIGTGPFFSWDDGTLYYYENTGTPEVAAFTLITSTYQNIVGASSQVAPAFADIDGDGDQDLFVAISSGGQGQVHFYRNDGNATSPVWTQITDNYMSIQAQYVTFGDADGDGDLDMFTDREYYRNDGNATQPGWVLRGTPYGLAWSGGPPVLGDLLNDDGRPDLLLGGNGGLYLYYNVRGIVIEPPVIPVLPRDQTLYFNGQQWGSVVCWNPYSSNCNNAMAISQGDNARGTVWETPYLYNMLDGKQYPLLADGDYTWNADRTEITFTIKSTAHWSDGTPVTAEDVAYTWATHVRYGIPNGGYQDYIDAIEAVDLQTVRVKAKLDGYGKAVSPLMVSAYLSSKYVIQKAWTQTLEARASGDGDALMADPGEDFVASGPYMKYFSDDTQVVLIRDDNYWGQAAAMWGKLPAPKYLAHSIYADNATGLAAFKAGEVDVSQMFIPNVQNWWLVDHLPISTYLPAAPYQIGASIPTAFYNLHAYGLDNVVIRKAIAIAVDYDTIIADAMTNQSATFHQAPRSLMNPSPGEQALYDHAAVADLQWAGNDIAGAKALLDAAGIVDTDADGWREYNGQKLSYVATCPNGWSDWQAAIEVVAAVGEEIGIEITTNYPEWSVYQAVVTKSDAPLPEGYDIFMMWSAGAGPTMPWGRIRNLIGSEWVGLPSNWSGNWGQYVNPRVDELIQAIPSETDEAQLKEMYTELVEIYLTDIPSFALMYRPQSFHTVNETVWTNFPHQGDGTNPPVPPLNLIDGYSIAGLYNLTVVPSCYVRVSSLPGITYHDLQTAIDAAQPGDTLKVAGTCTTVHRRPDDLAPTGVVTQVAYIDKSLTLQGGYIPTNWLHPDPVVNPTTLDALGQGRVVYVTGDVNVTLNGFRITGGDATGQGGSPWAGEDAGGGVYVITATVTFHNNQVFDNTTNGSGGGLYSYHSALTLRNNNFALNRGGWGGGAYLHASTGLAAQNTFDNNMAVNSGGGLYVYGGAVTLDGNTIQHNVAHDGGGLSIYQSAAPVNGNLIRFNTAGYGGGVELNRAGGRWANNVIADNQATLEGSGIYVYGATTHLLHTTLARNGGGSGVGLYVTEHAASGTFSTLTLTNTILADHEIGISVTGGNALTADTLLWHNTPITVSQSPTAVVTILNDWTADPRFDADGYHLRIGSPAIDAGLPVALARDVDGDPRPYGNGFDLGADEAPYIEVPPETGGTLVYTNTEGSQTTLIIPPAAVSETTTIVLTQLDPETVAPPPALVAGGIALKLDAYQGDEQVTNFTFSAPVTLTLEYTDEDVAGIEESSFRLYRYVCADPESMLLCVWEVIGTRPGEGQTLDMGNNVLTAWLLGFTRFGGMGESLQPAWELGKAYTSNRVAGTPITYTLTLVNNGSADATDVVLEDVIPLHLTWTSGGTLALNRVRWTFEAITASGGTAVGQFTAALPCTASLAIVNNDYRVVSSAQGVTSTVGPPVSFSVISPTITVGINYTPSAPVAGDVITFTATATTNGTPLSYAWSFGGTGPSATHTYFTGGTYTVTVTATDACGFAQIAEMPVTVKPVGYMVYLPLVMRE